MSGGCQPKPPKIELFFQNFQRKDRKDIQEKFYKPFVLTCLMPMRSKPKLISLFKQIGQRSTY